MAPTTGNEKTRKKRNLCGSTASTLSESQMDSLILVLDQIRHGNSNTRRDIIAHTGLSRAVVVQRLGELVERGLVEDGESGASTGGRAPRLLKFRGQAGYLLTADIGATSIVVALTDLAAQTIAHRAEPASIVDGPAKVLGRVDALFREVMGAGSVDAGQLWGIGIGLPGPVEFRTGRPVAPPIMPGWDGFPVRETFVERYGVPVWVDNDVNVMALGELRAGAARGHKTVVFVKVGTGIGAGLIIGGELHRGAKGCAGDVGHIQVTDDPTVICRCGNTGCVEAIAGGAALARSANQAAREGRSELLAAILADHELEAADLTEAASHGDGVSLEILANAARRVGEMLAELVNVLNPSLIVIGGGVATAGDIFLAGVRQAIYGRSTLLATRDLQVKLTALPELGGVIGAASMAADELFAVEQLSLWLCSGDPRVLLPDMQS